MSLTQFFKKGLNLIQLLSIDVAIGGVVLTNSIAYAIDVDLPWSISIAIFTCIWLIYTLDHLLDAKKVKGLPTSERHKFHQENGTTLFYILIIVSITSLSVLFFLPERTLFWGIIASALVGIYFLFTWWFRVVVAKEFVIGILYAIGVCLGPFSLSIVTISHYLVLFTIAILAVTNLMLFSLVDIDNDSKDGYASWATIFGLNKIKRDLNILFVLSAFVTESLLIYAFSNPKLILLSLGFFLISTTLFFLYSKRSKFATPLFRYLGDAVFILPSIVFLY